MCRICRGMAGVGFVVGIWDAVQVVIVCGCCWVTSVGVIVGGGRSSRVGASHMCRGVADVGYIVGSRDVVWVGRSGGCRGVTDVGVFEGGGSMRNCIGCDGWVGLMRAGCYRGVAIVGVLVGRDLRCWFGS